MQHQPKPTTPHAEHTRTCIHTPGAPLNASELPQDKLDSILNNAALVYFDGRLTEAALLLARAARQKGVPVLVEAERLRPHLEDLLQEANYVCTSAHFPQVSTCLIAIQHNMHGSSRLNLYFSVWDVNLEFWHYVRHTCLQLVDDNAPCCAAVRYLKPGVLGATQMSILLVGMSSLRSVAFRWHGMLCSSAASQGQCDAVCHLLHACLGAYMHFRCKVD